MRKLARIEIPDLNEEREHSPIDQRRKRGGRRNGDDPGGDDRQKMRAAHQIAPSVSWTLARPARRSSARRSLPARTYNSMRRLELRVYHSRKKPTPNTAPTAICVDADRQAEPGGDDDGEGGRQRHAIGAHRVELGDLARRRAGSGAGRKAEGRPRCRAPPISSHPERRVDACPMMRRTRRPTHDRRKRADGVGNVVRAMREGEQGGRNRSAECGTACAASWLRFSSPLPAAAIDRPQPRASRRRPVAMPIRRIVERRATSSVAVELQHQIGREAAGHHRDQHGHPSPGGGDLVLAVDDEGP